MKKHFTKLFLTALMMVVAVLFTSCGEEVAIEPTVSPSVPTVFSTDEADLTRTSMNNRGNFFWEPNDKIWVFDDTNAWKWSERSNITGTQATGKFIVDGTFGGAGSYNVIYTGYTRATGTPADTATTSYSTVTIADQQTQSAWNNSKHLSYSGDCGTGTAHKQPGGYKFTLKHEASYLMFYPYLHSTLSSNNYTLQKIEILADGQYVAGQFDFTFANGLADMPIAGQGKQSITLTCNGGFALSGTVPDLSTTNTYNHCFVVIAPGTHQLTIRYFVKNSSGTEYTFVKDLAMTKYEPNGVYPYIHVLKDALISPGYRFPEAYLYQWGASTNYYGANPDYNQSTTEATNGFWASTPTRDALYDYCINSNRPYWDNATEWTYARRGGTEEIRRGGVWIKKKAYRTTPYTGSTLNAPILGRPDAAVLNQYFFLPALSLNGTTIFWSRTANGTNRAYCFTISKSSVGITGDYYKHNTGFAYQRLDGTPWFQ